MNQEIKQLRRQVRELQTQRENERLQADAQDVEQRATIRHERQINERLTREVAQLERKLRRCEDQRRAILLVLESPAESPIMNTSNTVMMERRL